MTQRKISREDKQAANNLTLVMAAGTMFTTLVLSLYLASLLSVHALLLLPATAGIFMALVVPVNLVFRYVLGYPIAALIGFGMAMNGRKVLKVLGLLLAVYLLLRLGQCGGFLVFASIGLYFFGVSQRSIK